jgi:hypothetical protein
MNDIIKFGSVDWYSTINLLFTSDPNKTMGFFELKRILNKYNVKYNVADKKTLEDVVFGHGNKSPYLHYFDGEFDKQKTYITYDLDKAELLSCFLKRLTYEEQLDVIDGLFATQKYVNEPREIQKLTYSRSSNFFDQYLEIKREPNITVRLEYKRNILCGIFREIEPERDRIKSFDKKYDIIFFIANSYHIRHNNLDGKNFNPDALQCSIEELEVIYNKLFNVITVIDGILKGTTQDLSNTNFEDDLNFLENLKPKQ